MHGCVYIFFPLAGSRAEVGVSPQLMLLPAVAMPSFFRVHSGPIRVAPLGHAQLLKFPVRAAVSKDHITSNQMRPGPMSMNSPPTPMPPGLHHAAPHVGYIAIPCALQEGRVAQERRYSPAKDTTRPPTEGPIAYTYGIDTSTLSAPRISITNNSSSIRANSDQVSSGQNRSGQIQSNLFRFR